jgi:hypothetical protein
MADDAALFDRHFPKDAAGVPIETPADAAPLPAPGEPPQDPADPCATCGKAWYFLQSFTDGDQGFRHCDDCGRSWPVAATAQLVTGQDAPRSVRSSERGGSADRTA